MKTLTDAQAYAAMFHFLKNHWMRGKSDEIAILLSGMSMLPDGSTSDPAVLQDWEHAVARALMGEGPDALDLQSRSGS